MERGEKEESHCIECRRNFKDEEDYKEGKKVKEMLYTHFTGSAATRYGTTMEKEALNQYVAHQQLNGHSGLAVEPVGLCISNAHPWLSCISRSVVHDPVSMGNAKIKNSYSVRDKTVLEFGSKPSSCLEVNTMYTWTRLLLPSAVSALLYRHGVV